MEVLVVIAITMFFLGIGIFVSTDVYRSSLFQADADTVVSALQRARSRAINNINESPHGVHIATTGYTIFQGSVFNSSDPKNEIIPIRPGYTFNPASPIDIVFQQLSGRTSYNGAVDIINTAKTITININNEGRIDF